MANTRTIGEWLGLEGGHVHLFVALVCGPEASLGQLAALAAVKVCPRRKGQALQVNDCPPGHLATDGAAGSAVQCHCAHDLVCTSLVSQAVQSAAYQLLPCGASSPLHGCCVPGRFGGPWPYHCASHLSRVASTTVSKSHKPIPQADSHKPNDAPSRTVRSAVPPRAPRSRAWRPWLPAPHPAPRQSVTEVRRQHAQAS